MVIAADVQVTRSFNIQISKQPQKCFEYNQNKLR